MDFELLLFDRIKIIQDLNTKYDLENNSYIAFSGGKDSTCLSYLIDLALPNNNIPRVYSDTGIEYNLVRSFVLDLQKNDKRIVVVRPSKPIQTMLQDVGYPFKSKYHSGMVDLYQRFGNCKTVNSYLNIYQGKYGCPSNLKYQFSDGFNIKVSKKCCDEMKKKPSLEWSIANNKSIVITGIRSEEGGVRSMLKGCSVFKDGTLYKFHPLLVCGDDFIDWFINQYNVRICDIYLEPYNFDRTGCKGCPYNPDLKSALSTMEKFFPIEYKQCQIIWKPIYDEYRRIGYRL